MIGYFCFTRIDREMIVAVDSSGHGSWIKGIIGINEPFFFHERVVFSYQISLTNFVLLVSQLEKIFQLLLFEN